MKYLIDFVILALVYCSVLLPRWKHKGTGVLVVNTLMYLYLSSVLYFTLMPIIAYLPYVLNHRYVPMNLIPFVDVLARRGDFLRQIVLNTVMTLPFGFLFPLTQDRSAKFVKTVSVCFLMSLGIELLQPFFNRSSDITDLITNVLGGALGYGVYCLAKPVLRAVTHQE